MHIGKLDFKPINESFDLVAHTIKESVQGTTLAASIYVAKINPDLADTALFCKAHDVDLAISTNCLIIEATRADRTWYAACLILATDMADINGVIRKHLNARKTSFAPIDIALKFTHMEYGGITPLGLPKEWPILIDGAVMKHDVVVIGGGIRGSKIAIKTTAFSLLPQSTILKMTKTLT
jgi:prolyl-tRNA editing enzyme YbaK/EbsC (Cys-tRNA(Pro) deacylase)